MHYTCFELNNFVNYKSFMQITSTIDKRKLNFVLLDDKGVGKTSINQRFSRNTFDENGYSTVGVDVVIKKITRNSTDYRLQLWDISGQERFRQLIPSYLKDAAGVIFVIDKSNCETLANLHSWIDMSLDNCGKETVMAVCRNKSDLVKQDISIREHDMKIINGLLQKHKMKYFVWILNHIYIQSKNQTSNELVEKFKYSQVLNQVNSFFSLIIIQLLFQFFLIYLLRFCRSKNLQN